MFLVQTYWVTGSHHVTEYRKKSGCNVQHKSMTDNFAQKLEKTSSVLDECRKHHWQMPKATIVDVCVCVCVCQFRAVSQKIFVTITPWIWLSLFYAKEPPRKQRFSHMEGWQSINYCNQTRRNEFVTVNGFRTSFTILCEYLTSYVAVQSKEWVFGRSLTSIVGSNPTGGMNVCLLWLLCVVR
jgi:hypothetical protein